MLASMGSQGVRRAGALTLLVGMLLTLSGCAKASLAITIRDDDTVTMVAKVEVSTALLSASGTDIDTLVDTSLPKDWPVASRQRFVDGDYTGVQLNSERIPLSSITIGTAHVKHANHLYVVDGVLDTSAVASSKGQDASFVVSVTFPGDVRQTNGQRSGRTVTWTGQTGGVVQLHAIADDGFFYRIGQQVGFAGVQGISLVILVSIAVIAIRSRRRDPLEQYAFPVPVGPPPVPAQPWSGPATWTPQGPPPESRPDPREMGYRRREW